MPEFITKTLTALGRVPIDWIRSVVAVYFLAICVGILPGAGIEGITGLFLSPASAELMSGMCIALLAIMLLAGTVALPAAVTLSVLVLVSGGILMVGPGYPGGIAVFLRDLALIAALGIASLRAGLAARSAPTPLRLFRQSRIHGVVGQMVPAPIPDGAEAELRLAARQTPARWRSTRHIKALLEADGLEEVDNIFVFRA